MKKDSFTHGVGYMLLSATGLAFTGLFGKLGAPLFTLEALIFWRFVTASILALALLLFMGELRHFFSFHHPKIHIMRAAFVLGAQYSFYYYIQRDTLLNGMVLLSLGPLFIPFIEWVITKEPIGKSTWVGLAVSFAGMICILQPDKDIFTLLSLVGILAGLCQGCSQVVFGISPKEEGTYLGTFYMLILCVVISLIPYLLIQTTWGEETKAPLVTLLLVLGMGAASVLNQMMRASAYLHGTPSRLSTFLYFSILLGGIFDWLVFDRTPNTLSLIGALLVIAGGILKIYLRALILGKRPREQDPGP